MLTGLAALAAMLLDPLVLIACWLFAPMIGAYRVAVPVCAVLSAAIYVGTADAISLYAVAGWLLVGLIHSTLAIFAWRLIPDRLKSRLTSN